MTEIDIEELKEAASGNYRRFRMLYETIPTNAENYQLVRDAFVIHAIPIHTEERTFTLEFVKVLTHHLLNHESCDTVWLQGEQGLMWTPIMSFHGGTNG